MLQIPFWHGKVQARQVNKILRNMQFVADTYDFVVHEEDEKRAHRGDHSHPGVLGSQQVRGW